jgi:hypothetical protein
MQRYLTMGFVSFLVGVACLLVYVCFFNGGSHQDIVRLIVTPSETAAVPRESPYYAQAVAGDVGPYLEAQARHPEIFAQIRETKPKAMQIARQLDLLEGLLPFVFGIPILTVVIVWSIERGTQARTDQTIKTELLFAKALSVLRERCSWYILVPVVLAGFVACRELEDWLVGLPIIDPIAAGVVCFILFVVALVCKSLDTIAGGIWRSLQRSQY